MKQLYRRFLAMILVVAMGLTMLPMEAFAEAYSGATQINLQLAGGSVPIKIQKLDENGDSYGDPEEAAVKAGDVSTTAPQVSGYDFLYAKVNDSEVSYLGSYDGKTYYSDSDNNAVLLIVPDGTTPVFYYEPHVEVYSVEYNLLKEIEDVAYDGLATVRADTPLTFQVTTPRGCETTVTYTMGNDDSETLTEKYKSSTPDGDTLIYEIGQVTADVQIEIDVEEIQTFRYGMEYPEWTLYGHGATFNPPSGTFTRDKHGFTWTLTGGTHGGTYWIMNGLEINGEDLSIPFSQGDTTTTTLSTGTAVTITWTSTRTNSQDRKYNIYTISVSNAYEDIYITGGNFRASGHKEVMPTLISPGVVAEWYRSEGKWKPVISSNPIGFVNRVVQIRYKLELGYENLRATVNNKTANSTGPDGEGWYKITISDSQVDSSRGFADVQITCDLAEYTVSYSGGEQPAAENLPFDDQQYDVVNNTTIYIPSDIPTADNMVFQGWDVDEDGAVDYRPAVQVSLTDVLDHADRDNRITFEAIWKSVEESVYVTYTINLYLEGQDVPVDTYTGQGIAGTQLLVRSQEGSWIADQLAEYPDYELPENFTNTITLDKDGENTVDITLVRKMYTVTYDSNGGTGTMEKDSVESGEGYTVKGNEFTKTGYKFTGWNTKQDGTGAAYSENATIENVRENITLYAQWEQATATYIVQHWFEKVDSDEYEQNSAYVDQQFTGQIGQSTNATSYAVTGFTARAITQGTIAASGTVVNVYYDRNKHDVTYTYTDAEGNTKPYTEANQTGVKFGATVTVADSPSVPQGYEFSGWTSEDVTTPQGVFTMPDKNVAFTGSITPKTDTKYTVEWFFEKVDGTYNDTPDKVDATRFGTTGQEVSVTAQDKEPQENYPNYVFDGENEDNVLTSSISGNGTTVLKLYFERKQFSVKYEYSGTVPEDANEKLPGESQYKWGVNVDVDPTLTEGTKVDGYVFSGWSVKEPADLNTTGGSFTMPQQTVTFTGSWTKRTDLSYTVNHYLVGTTLKVKDSETVYDQVFGDNVPVPAGDVPDGYALQSNTTQNITIKVTENVVTFYYYKLATVKADDQEMTYGGTVPPLTATVTGLYGSDEATKITYNTPTTTATSTSPVDKYPIEVTGNAIQGYYKVTYVPGELIINPATMNLTVKGYDDFYDGAAHGGTVSGYPEGATLQYSTDNGSTWKEEEPTVTDYTENPVAVQVKVTLANYDEVIREYTLNVKKRPVTLVSEGATREYNGEALTNANWHYEGKYEFVNGEVTEISTIGTQTEIGSSKNTIAYKKTAEFDEGNYIITLKEGYLVVTPPQNPNEYDVVTKTHDKNNLNPGEIVTFTITVKNIFADTATVTLNELPGVSFSENGTNELTFQLNGGETKEVKATYTITEADVLAGQFVNTVSATLVVGDQTVEASATDTVTLKAAPALTVDKTVTSRPTNGSTYALGETITWSITVTNSGNVTLEDIQVSDSLTYQGDESGNKLSGTLTPPAGFDGNLDRGESVTYTYSYQVTEADLGKTLVNTATATGKDSNDKDAEPDSDEADPVRTDDLKPSLSVTKTADRETAAVGETINYTITVTNNGNQTLNSIKVTDPLTGLNQEISTLKPGEAFEAFKTSYTVKVSDLIAGSVVNTATAEAGNVTAEARKTVAITGSLNISVTLNSGEFTYDGQEHTVSGIKSVTYGNDVISVNNGTFKIGDTTFTLSCAENTATATGTDVVRNPDGTVGSYPVTAQPTDITVKMGGQNVTGKVTVTNVIAGSLQINPRKVTITVQDAEKTYGESDPTPFQAVLSGDPLVNDTDLGTITCSRTNEDEDAGVYEDVLTAAYTDNKNYDVTVVNGDFTIKQYTLPVVVTIEGTSAEKPYTGSEQSVEGYTITGITVNGVESELYPEASVQFVGEPYDKVASGTYVGEYTMALNKDDFENGNANFTNVTFQVTPGKLTITPGTYQPVTKTHEEKQDGSKFALNETVTFPITVVNIYNTPAKVTLKEQEGVFFEGGSQTAEQVLGPGDKMIFNAYYVITEQDILNESFTNTVEWTIARIDDSEKITGTAADTVEVVAKAPKLTVSKTVKNSVDAPFDLNETITYTITVKNDGNVTVTGINVADLVTTEGENRQAATVNAEAFALKPGEDKSFEYTYKVQQSDLGKTILNTATATGSDPTGEEVVGTDDVEAETEERNPKLDVTKVASKPANGTEFVLDETITYTITVKNTGNVTLADIFVSDEFSRDDGATWDVQKDKLTPSASTPITLEPGEKKIYTYQYTVVEEDLGKTLKNTATATAPNPDDPSQSVTDGATTPGEKVEDPKPDLSVTKEVVNKQTSYRVGDVITYKITVNNTGNTTLHNLSLVDSMNAAGKVTFTDLGGGTQNGSSVTLASLAPKAIWTVTCTYKVQLADADSDGNVISNKVVVTSDEGPDDDSETPGEKIDPIYTLTIKYQNGARVDLRDPDTVKLHAGDVYTVVAPSINGYHLSDKAFAEFDFTMRDRDTTIVIIYAANPVEDDDDDPVVNPDNDPDETTEETTEETEDEVDPGVYIEDPDDYTLTPITEEEPPLADLDVGDHTCCIMHFLLMLAAMVVLGFYTDSKKKHQARIFELKRTLAMEKGKNPDGDNSQQS